MALHPITQEIAAVIGYSPLTNEEGQEPADTSLCNRKVEVRDGWPNILWKGEWYPVPTLEECEEWVFDSTCFTPDEDEVEPDHPSSWLSILVLI
jgi:hypothetical protein